MCNSKSIQVDILEEAVWEEVKMVLREPEAMTKEYQLRLVKHESTEAKDELEKRASKIEQGIERLAYVYARGHITKEKYDLEVESMERELKGIRDQREETVDEKRLQRELDFITSSVENFSSEVESELNQADWETKLDIIRKLVQRIEIDNDNVHVVFRLKELALERQKKSVQHCIGSPVSSTGMTPERTNGSKLKKISLIIHGLICFCFLLFTLLESNPFTKMPGIETDGLGFNPILQDIGLAIHPPILYLGYLGFSVPFSLSIAGLILNTEGNVWAKIVRPWVLISWSLLTLGISLGSWWAYRELGWGGFWFWDPVENVSLMPWLI
ncbi:MAG: cytochrome c biogenesis protein CcsA, partial [Wolbachia pipientis]